MRQEDGTVDARSFLAGGGEMGRRLREHGWEDHPLGPPERWPAALKASLGIGLDTRFPIAIYWGPEALLLYNDAWRPIVGDKHPAAVGRPGSEVWSEIWDVVGPVFRDVLATGHGSFQVDAQLSMRRFGYTEECYFDYTFSPIRGQDGAVEGVFNAVTETTERVLNLRRGRLLREVSSRCAAAKSSLEACELAAAALATDPHDVPFALFYVIDETDGAARLAASAGVVRGASAAPARIATDEAGGSPWPVHGTARTRRGSRVPIDRSLAPGLPRHPWPEAPEHAFVLPVETPGAGGAAAVLVLGISPRRAFDSAYEDFFALLGSQVATALANARAHEDERRRAEALAEIDRAKTAFFSNVSHEFRTPLTLMLGPLEDALRGDRGELPAGVRRELEVVHGNGLRLQKLVNALLDFSRVEAGRAERTAIEAADAAELAALTEELANSFRAVIEKAGMRLVVACDEVLPPVKVDRDTWEKIVLNLLSNAFKHTFAGEIAVRLRERDGAVELAVSDTGVGIPKDALPRLFERFFRVEGARSRTHEGTGIGLALVDELVRVHGGRVQVESEPGAGSTFTVSLPAAASGPRAGRSRTAENVSSAPHLEAFVREAAGWSRALPPPREEVAGDSAVRVAVEPGLRELRVTREVPECRVGRDVEGATIVVAEDSADLREYLERLLGKRFRLVLAADGEAALEAVRRERAELVLADVMMPRLDGFGLLAALRADPKTRMLPVILLSARAGEEARLEGLDAGADDYLVKPFSSRELSARVEAALRLSRMRSESERASKHGEDRLRAILESLGDSFLAIDRDGTIAYANRVALEKSGKAAEQLIGVSVWDAFPLWRGTGVEAGIRTAFEGERVELEILGPHTERWYDVSLTPTPDGIAIYSRDITSRVEAEEELRRGEIRLRLVTDALPVLIAYVDAEERYRFNNQAYERWFGRPAEELRGRTLREVLGDSAYREVGPRARLALEGETVSFELQLPYQDAGLRDIEATYVPDREASGAVRGFYAMVLDVTDRKRAHQALRESEDRYRTLFDSMDEGFCTIEVKLDEHGRGIDYRFLDLNHAFEGQTGLRDVRGKWMRELEPRHEQHWFDVYARIATTGESMRFENRAAALGRWYEVHAFRIGPPAARQVAVLFNDVSPRRNAQVRTEFLVHLDDAVRPLLEPEEITAAAARLLGTHLAANRCAYADVEEDADTFNLTGNWSDGVASIVGRYRFTDFGAECLRQMRAGETYVVSDSEIDPRTADVRAAYRSTETRSVICAPLHKAGRFAAAMAVHQAGPRVWRTDEIELVEQVSARCWESIERARALRVLRESENRLRSLFEQSIAGIAETDLSGRILRVNQRYCEILGREAEELCSMRMQDLTHPDDVPRNLELFGPLAEGRGQPFVIDKRYLRPDGSIVWVTNNVSVVRGDRGEPLRCVAVSIDVTERQRRDQERRELLDSERAARVEAQRATHLKDEFVATLSHELRTPVNAMLGWSQLGRRGALVEGDVRHAFEVIERNARVQAQLISDLLDVSRIVAGKLHLDNKLVDPRQVVVDALAAVEQSALAKGITIARELDPRAGPVSGDPARLQQVAWNLLSNAIKFTPAKGRIEVVLERIGTEILLTVKDDGRGIEPAFLPHLFERFRQADASTTRSAGGLGLGLAIAKKLVEMHGGSISAESDGPGHGSTFLVRLPTAGSQFASEAPSRLSDGDRADSVRLEGVRVLVVDDEVDARDLVRRVLVDRGAEVVTVGSAKEALESLAQEHPSVLVSDIGMPEEDGYALLRKVRGLAGARSGDVPAIALTAFARPEDRTRALLAGFQAHVTKPVDAEELCATIATLLGRTGE